MYTIIMNSDKSLTASVKTTLYQREKLADKIQFLLPQKYGDFDIRDATILLKYIDQGNVSHAEKLVMDEELYKERVRCVIDVDTNLTRFAGDILIHLDIVKLNTDGEISGSVLTTGELTITISSLRDYFAYVSDESLDIINRNTLELEAMRKAYDILINSYEDSVDDLTLTEDLLQVSANGVPKGNGVSLSSIGGSITEEGIPVVDINAKTNEGDTDDEPGTDMNDRDVVEF